jgi:hypothetical protein
MRSGLRESWEGFYHGEGGRISCEGSQRYGFLMLVITIKITAENAKIACLAVSKGVPELI